MKINLIWINLFAIIYATKQIGASISASDLNDLNIYDDEEFNYNEVRSLRKFSQKDDENSHQISTDEAVVPVDEKSKNNLKDEAVQVVSQMKNNEALAVNSEQSQSNSIMKTTQKRKSFTSKKRKKKKRKQSQQKNKIIHGVKNENFELLNVGKRVGEIEGNNYFITTTTSSSVLLTSIIDSSMKSNNDDNSFAIVNKLNDGKSNKSVETTTVAAMSSTTDEIIMEMVEAIIDNNNSINNYINNNLNDDNDVNLWKKLSNGSNMEANKQAVESEDSNNAKMGNTSVRNSINSTNEVKINEQRLKQMSKNKSKTNGSSKRRKRRKILIGDLSCMKAEFIEAPRVTNADIKYIRNEMYGIERSFLEAEYHCHAGYRLIKKSKQKTNANKNLVCKKRRWIGQKPECVQVESNNKSPLNVQQCDSYEAQKCEQLCIKSGNKTEVSCHCHKGFRLIGTRCLDINECEEDSNVCGHGKCINLIGTHKCLCQQGFKIDNNGKCVDINECLLRGGHGPCQDRCLNKLGGYTCTCENLKNTQLSKDGHSCEEIDLCSVDNGGCSHTCHSSIGQTFCTCPMGFKLDIDWKTCIDIDECQLQEYSLGEVEQKCNYECINTIGSYKCIESRDIGADEPFSNNDFDEYIPQQQSIDNNEDYRTGSDDTDGNYDIIDGASFVSECLNGFYFNETIGNCLDINECEIDNGNCLNGTCINTNGSFYCSCHKGFVLSEDDKYKCIEKNKNITVESPLNRVIVACPALFPPIHGYLECTRPLESSNITGRIKVTNRPGSQCQLRCPSSYRASGTYLKTCGEDGKWHGYDDGICIKYPTPRLICPSNQLVELPLNSDKVEIKLQKPKTDVNFKRDVAIKPSWIKNVEKITLGLGVLNITYIARHPISKLTVACTTTLFVVDGEAPTVEYCPPSQKHKIEKHHESIKAFWIEPKFSDNVKVTDVTQTNLPGTLFGLGSHQIIYEARDAAGYKTRCTFKIIVNAPKHSGLKLPIKNNKFYY
ncbi:hypothetical protein PVAND_007504 [Polypedilum vanderplanki]|uniref:Uncharacterized protein n=1 Tax=Polypedilum vanderplanki TaxID=319348 RepID=A0A9J6C759_POLVA|nr:hypothetical protein PVAND_007504 [Polypedilum vanderplanki]